MESLGGSFQNIRTGELSASPVQRRYYKKPYDATYTCPVCNRTVPPRYNQKGFYAGFCDCEIQKKQQEERKRNRLIVEQTKAEAQKRKRTPEYCWGWKNAHYIARADRTFDDFKPNSLDNIQNLSSAKQFAARPAGTLLFQGPSGNGKSILADAVVNDLRRNYSCIHITGPDLFDELAKEYSNPEEYERFMKRIQNTDVLYLEDPEKARDTKTGHRQEKYMQIFNGLYAAKKIIIITTNLDLKEDLWPLDEYLGKAVVSRLCENILECKFKEVDMRRATKKWTPGAEAKK